MDARKSLQKSVFFSDENDHASGYEKRRTNLEILFNYTTLIPFKWRSKYMCFHCCTDVEYTELREHTKSHGHCTSNDKALRDVTGKDVEVKLDVSHIACEICEEPFESFDEIIDHLIVKHKLPYNKNAELTLQPYRLVDLKCLLCDEHFNFFSKLIAHVNNKHPKHEFRCDFCKHTFNKKRDLAAHCRMYHKEDGYNCDECLLNFTSVNGLRSHNTSVHPSMCNICFNSYPTVRNKLRHIKLDHNGQCPVKCGFCLKQFTTNKSFIKHAESCTKELSKNKNVDDAGKTQIKQIRNNLACLLNMSTVIPFKNFLNRFRCFYCPKDFTECSELKEHTVLEHPHCDIKLKSMKLRNRARYEGVKVDVSSLSCKVCCESFDELDLLIDHLIVEHKARYNKAVDLSLLPYKLIKDNYPCPYCSEVFRYFSTLLRHVGLSHTDNRNLCVYCGKSFRTDASLRVHIASYHKTKRIKCPNCTIQFTTNNALHSHLGKAHGKKIFRCTKCSEKFVSDYAKLKHLIVTHGSGHKCEYCGKLFTKKSFMVNHVRRTHLKEKNVECSVCHERFFDVHLLRMHMVKHMGVRNFHCDICDAYEGTYERTAERRRKNLQILFNNTSVIPFKWRGRYLCFYCGENHTNYTDFRKHTLSHGPCTTKDYSLKVIKGNHIEIKVDVSDITCIVCTEPFNSFKEIIDHLIIKHSLEYDSNVDTPFQEYRLVDFRCLLCDKQFSYFGYLVQHVNNAHPNNCFVCNDCKATFNKKRDLSVHMRNFHRHGGYKCELCMKIFKSLFTLRKHQKNMHFSFCNFCGLSFSSNSLLQKHTLIDHPDDGSFKCNHCAKICHSSQGLKQHFKKCKAKLASIEPMKNPFAEECVEPKKKQDLQQIRLNIQCVLNMSTAIPFKFFSSFACFYCCKKFGEFEELKQHTISEHPVCDVKANAMRNCKGERITIKIDVTSLACKLCCVAVDNIDDLVDHLIKKHTANYDKSITGCFEPYRVMKDNMPCPICPDLVFRYFNILLRHMNSVHNNNNRICDHCGRSFKSVTNLKVHIAHTHMASSECDLCGGKFKNQWCLLRHKASTHDVKSYKCSKCPEKFLSQYHKQKHLIEVHNIGHKCSYCSKMFTRNSFMKDHIRRSHLKEKNVSCGICNEKFFDNYLLKLHMVKHYDDRRFKCEVCAKEFLRRSNLDSHKKLHKKYGHIAAQT